MKISETLLKTLNHLLIPIILSVISIVLFFVIILPYQKYSAEFDTMKSNYEKTNQILNSNLQILKKVSESKTKVEKFNNALKSLVPDSANPSDVVGLIDKNANALRFRNIDENRSISGLDNDRNRLIEVRFNGKSPGVASSINFLKSLTSDKSKLIKITRVELTNVPEELFTRISFNAYSLYSGARPEATIETPIQNIFENKTFTVALDTF